MIQRIPSGLPSVFQAIASPQCDPNPRPFEGDPYDAAQPLLDRLDEILGTYTDKDFTSKTANLRERILGLARRVPEWHNHVFNRIVGIAQEIFDGMAPPVVKTDKFQENCHSWAQGIGIRNGPRADPEQCAVTLIAPIIAAVKEREGSEIIAWKFPSIHAPMLNCPCAIAHFGDLEVMFRATEEMGFMQNEFRIAVATSCDAMGEKMGWSRAIEWKQMPERW